jgi:hypothetical protein
MSKAAVTAAPLGRESVERTLAHVEGFPDDERPDSVRLTPCGTGPGPVAGRHDV